MLAPMRPTPTKPKSLEVSGMIFEFWIWRLSPVTNGRDEECEDEPRRLLFALSRK